MAIHLITKTEFAKLCGVSQAAITKACRTTLADAVTHGRIDLDHPAAQEYLAGKNGVQPVDPLEVVGDDLAGQSFYAVVKQLSTDPRMKDWLRALKEAEILNERRIRNGQRADGLVSRELVNTAILAPIEEAFAELLTEGAAAIAHHSLAISRAGEDDKAIKAMLEDYLASFIRPVKDRMRKALIF